MKQFLTRCVTFILPILALTLICEIALKNIPNDYKFKHDQLEKRSQELEVLFLGSSHAYHAVNPEYIEFKSFNASHNGQSLYFDYLIFKKYQNRFNKLKIICIPVSYHTLFYDVKEDEERKKIQNYVTHSQVFKSSNPRNNLEILSLDFKDNYNRFVDYYLHKKKNGSCSHLGHLVLPKGDKKFDELCAKRLNQQTHKLNENQTIITLKKNLDILANFAEIAKNNNTSLILYSTPHHSCFTESMSSQQYSLMLKSLNNLKTKYKNIIEYKNYTTLFKSEQGNFHDPDHLNEKGAAIFSKLLNNEIKRVVFTHDSIVKCSIKFK
jgi:hypothetical protein